MEEISFIVEGSSPAPYDVKFKKNGRNITATCTCPAGLNNTHCKHRLRILFGIRENIISDNAEQVEIVSSWLKGSDIEMVLNELQIAEEELDIAKQKVSKLKKKLARKLLD